MADDWLLYTTEAGWGLPSIEPSSIQAQVYLHLAGVPLSVQECSLSRSAPTGEGERVAEGTGEDGLRARWCGKSEEARPVWGGRERGSHTLDPPNRRCSLLTTSSLSLSLCGLPSPPPPGVTPSLEHRGELVDAPPSSPTAPADAAAAIIEYARAAGADLDAWLSPPQRAEAAAFACLARAGLEPASAFTTWCEPASYAAAKAAYGADLPFPLNALLPRSARKAAERRFAGQPRARVYGEAAAAVASLADRLAASPGPFFFGDRPCGLDALLYAHLAFHRAAPVAAPELKAALDARPRVGAFIDAVAARLASLGPPPPRGASASTDADWAARAEAAQAEWRRAGATGPRSGGGRRAGGSGRGASTTGAASQKSTSTASGLSVGAGNAVWLGAVGAIVTAYALLSGQYVEWALEDVVPFGEDEGGEE